MIVRSWERAVAVLRDRTGVVAAQAAADLLVRAQERWEDRVLPDLWMHDLRFVASGDVGRQVEHVRVGWYGRGYVFTLFDERDLAVSADHATSEIRWRLER